MCLWQIRNTTEERGALSCRNHTNTHQKKKYLKIIQYCSVFLKMQGKGHTHILHIPVWQPINHISIFKSGLQKPCIYTVNVFSLLTSLIAALVVLMLEKVHVSQVWCNFSNLVCSESHAVLSSFPHVLQLLILRERIMWPWIQHNVQQWDQPWDSQSTWPFPESRRGNTRLCTGTHLTDMLCGISFFNSLLWLTVNSINTVLRSAWVFPVKVKGWKGFTGGISTLSAHYTNTNYNI